MTNPGMPHVPANSNRVKPFIELDVDGALRPYTKSSPRYGRTTGADILLSSRTPEAEIDRHVYALYGLTPEEIKIVEGTAAT